MRVALFTAGLVVGACSTAAVTSSAAPDPSPTPVAASAPPVDLARRLVVPIGEAEVRLAPKGGATITILARGDNAFVGKLTMPAGGAVPEHRDPTEEYIHVLSGSGTITIDDVDHPLAPGTTVYMPADAKVRYQNGDAPLVALQVFAGPAPAAKYDAWTTSPAGGG